LVEGGEGGLSGRRIGQRKRGNAWGGGERKIKSEEGKKRDKREGKIFLFFLGEKKNRLRKGKNVFSEKGGKKKDALVVPSRKRSLKGAWTLFGGKKKRREQSQNSGRGEVKDQGERMILLLQRGKGRKERKLNLP